VRGQHRVELGTERIDVADERFRPWCFGGRGILEGDERVLEGNRRLDGFCTGRLGEGLRLFDPDRWLLGLEQVERRRRIPDEVR
jgi:hypothetical protein